MRSTRCEHTTYYDSVINLFSFSFFESKHISYFCVFVLNLNVVNEIIPAVDHSATVARAWNAFGLVAMSMHISANKHSYTSLLNLFCYIDFCFAALSHNIFLIDSIDVFTLSKDSIC